MNAATNQRPLEVLHVLGGLSLAGGTAGVCQALAAAGGADVRAAVWMHRNFAPPPRPFEFLCAGAIRRVPAGQAHDLFAAPAEDLALRRALRARRTDILHAHTRLGQLAAAGAARRTGLPLVIHVHFLARQRGLYRALWKYAQAALVFNSAKSCRHYGFDPASSFILPPTITWPDQPPPSGPCRVVHAAALVPVKGADRLLAARRLIPQCPPVHLIGARQPPDFPRFEAALRTQLASGDEILPWDSNWTATLSGQDIFVSPTAAEAFGIALLEAFARGLRIVAPRGSFLDELPAGVRQAGVFLAEDDSPAALARALALARAAPAAATEWFALRRNMREEYDVTVAARRLADFYRALPVFATETPS